jgi:diguanylate cyclase (GGDEF)-like protein
MISLSRSISDLERFHQERALVLDCYIAGIRNLAQYTIELNKEVTEQQRKHLTALASDVSAGTKEALEESRATLRGLLRDYRDKGAAYLGGLKEELSARARALEEIMGCLAQADGDHEVRIKGAMKRLRSISDGDPDVFALIRATADAIDQSIEQMRKQHQFTVSQFKMEIQMLHQRIDALESSAALDSLTRLFNRQDMEQRIQNGKAPYCLLLMRVSGFRRAEAQYRPDIAAELAAAFTKRLKNAVPAGTVIGRWGHEEFMSILALSKMEVIELGKRVGEQLSGAYSCLMDGKAVRATLQLSVAVIEAAGESPPRILAKIGAFFVGG